MLAFDAAIWQTSFCLRSSRVPTSARCSSKTDSTTPLAPARTFVGNNIKNTHKKIQHTHTHAPATRWRGASGPIHSSDSGKPKFEGLSFGKKIEIEKFDNTVSGDAIEDVITRISCIFLEN